MKHSLSRRALSPVIACVVGLGLGLAGCEEKAPPTVSKPQGGQPLGGLSDTPNSILGKTAKSGKNAGAAIERQQDQAANLANEISGQSGELVVGGLKFAVPSEWKAGKPASSMTAASYTLPGGSGVCTFATGIGGSVMDNINRWKSQVTGPTGSPVEPTITEHTAAGMKVTIVAMQGTFAAMNGAKQPNSGFRGAIIQSTTGNVFVRMNGPADQVSAQDAAFERMVLGVSR